MSICEISNDPGTFENSNSAYNYLKRVVGSHKNCTHIHGNLIIRGLDRNDDGSDPDLSFLKSIEEISGNLLISNNTVRKIPLRNLKVIRGISLAKSIYSMQILENSQKNGNYLEEIDFRSLRVIMRNNVLLSNNPGIQYLQQRIDWTQIIADSSIQKIEINPNFKLNNNKLECHDECTCWNSSENILEKFCFGPSQHECQYQTKCSTSKKAIWCNYNGSFEMPCDNNCLGGCYDEGPYSCAVSSIYMAGFPCSIYHESDDTVEFLNGFQGDPSNLRPDYPKSSICVMPMNLQPFLNTIYAYKFLQRAVGFHKNCTHISGDLVIRGIYRNDDGTDPDLSFLKSIEEISGNLHIFDNTVKRIPLSNLKVIRGLSMDKSTNSLEIIDNFGINKIYLEEVDLRNLRAIMAKNIKFGNNPSLQYLEKRIDWTQIIADPLKQEIEISPYPTNNKIYECHSQCKTWKSTSNITEQFCFGPSLDQCQQQTKCTTNKDPKWCNFTETGETPCNKNCVGGCTGETSADCTVCSRYLKGYDCTDTCARHYDDAYSRYLSYVSQDNLIYTVDSLCTSQCPASRLEQDKICVFQCDLDKYYRSGNRCLKCEGNCKHQSGDEIVCNLTEINALYHNQGRFNRLTQYVLEKLTNCTIIIGQIYITDESFSHDGVTIQMLYEHLNKVKEIQGELTVFLTIKELHNMTFLSNLVEIRPLVNEIFADRLLTIDVRSLKFLGLKKLKKVYGSINIMENTDNCYLDKIPWNEISNDHKIKSNCSKECHPLCKNRCWGPGNYYCYNCLFKEVGGYCVDCKDVPGFYFNQLSVDNESAKCGKCHNLCKQNCTGPLPTDCNDQCLIAKEINTCVESCSFGFYPTRDRVSEHDICERCDPSCNGCTGPKDILGKGGCSTCDMIRKTGINEFRCHKGICPFGYVKKAIPENATPDCRIEIMCESCNGNCSDDASNFNPDYPNISTCDAPENIIPFKDSDSAYRYLERILGSNKNCTHINGNLVIRDLKRMPDGSDPDLSFLESIEEISGGLFILDNTVRRIPLSKLKVVRGLSREDSVYSMRILENKQKNMSHLEVIDLSSLKVIMRNSIQFESNPGLQYLQHRIDWSQIVVDKLKQKIEIFPKSKNETLECHSECNSWKSSSNITEKFCFGPSKNECQQQTKCTMYNDSTWCHFTKDGEIPCDKNCVGGCRGQTSGDCEVCNQYLKGSNCTDTCTRYHNNRNNLIYVTDSLCTSQCPAFRLNQDNICVFQCNSDKYVRYENRCVECYGVCKHKTGSAFSCGDTYLEKYLFMIETGEVTCI